MTDKDTATICPGSPQTGPSIRSEHRCWWPTWSSVSVSTSPHTLSYPGPLSAQADPIAGDCEGGHSCLSAPVTAAAWTPCALGGSRARRQVKAKGACLFSSSPGQELLWPLSGNNLPGSWAASQAPCLSPPTAPCPLCDSLNRYAGRDGPNFNFLHSGDLHCPNLLSSQTPNLASIARPTQSYRLWAHSDARKGQWNLEPLSWLS